MSQQCIVFVLIVYSGKLVSDDVLKILMNRMVFAHTDYSFMIQCKIVAKTRKTTNNTFF